MTGPTPFDYWAAAALAAGAILAILAIAVLEAWEQFVRDLPLILDDDPLDRTVATLPVPCPDFSYFDRQLP